MTEVLSSSSPLLRQSPSQSSLFLGTSLHSVGSRSTSPSHHDARSTSPAPSQSASASSSPPETSSPLVRTPSFHSTPPSSISLDFHDPNIQYDDTENYFPSYGDNTFVKPLDQTAPPGTPDDSISSSVSNTPDEHDSISSESDSLLNPVADDIAVKEEPTRQVDYLSHDWREEDIWSSWKHIVSRRKIYGERSRLENASWRTWAKQKNHLKTVSPETLNWLKDCDVTWLYGPLQEGSLHKPKSESTSRLSKTSSFINKKPILKKRTVSEEMLQKSLSSSSLVKQAAAAVQAQRESYSRKPSLEKPKLRRTVSDFIAGKVGQPLNVAEVPNQIPSSSSSGDQTPDPHARRHIRFDNKVEQCIAVDFKEDNAEGSPDLSWSAAYSESDSDDSDDLPMLKTRSTLRQNSTPSSSRNSFSGESKGIAMLPSTTIKFHHDEPLCKGHPASLFHSARRSSIGSSASQETLRPSTPSSNFLIVDDAADQDIDWQPSGAFGTRDGILEGQSRVQDEAARRAEDEEQSRRGLRRTPSGMFMPFDECDEETMAANGILGRVTDTVNTVRDIATVIWNVGWQK